MANPLFSNRDMFGNSVFSPGSAGTAGGGTINAMGSGVSGALGTAGAINASNLAYTRGAERTDPTYAMIEQLLNPQWGPQLYDSAQAGAEQAAGGGISGSNLANFRGARLYSDDLKENAALANSLLTGAHGRVPTPYNPDRLITSPLDQARLNQEMTLAREREAGETNRALIMAASRGGGGGAGKGGSVRDAGGGTGVQGGWSNMPTLGGGRTGGGSTPFNGGGWKDGMWIGGGNMAVPSGNQVQFLYGNDLGGGGGGGGYESDYGPTIPDYGWGDTGGGGNDYGPTVPDYNWDGGGGGGGWEGDVFGALGGPGSFDVSGGGDDWWNQPVTVDNFEDYIPG